MVEIKFFNDILNSKCDICGIESDKIYQCLCCGRNFCNRCGVDIHKKSRFNNDICNECSKDMRVMAILGEFEIRYKLFKIEEGLKLKKVFNENRNNYI